MPLRRIIPRREHMEALVALGFIVAWLVLQLVILPKLGIRT